MEHVKIRTITSFVTLQPRDFDNDCQSLAEIVKDATDKLTSLKTGYTEASYEVQTVRIVFNTPSEYLDLTNSSKWHQQLLGLDQILEANNIDFCCLGRLRSDTPLSIIQSIPDILKISKRFNLSLDLDRFDMERAQAAALTVKALASYDVLANFRFCVSSQLEPGLPYFPSAVGFDLSLSQDKAPSKLRFALGLENGCLFQHVCERAKSLRGIEAALHDIALPCYKHLQEIAMRLADALDATYLGLDTSINPALTPTGSVAAAFEKCDAVEQFGKAGTLAAIAAVTQSVQALPIKQVGYRGLMLPVCEDTRLAELSAGSSLTMTSLLNFSSVCGVGIDTVPIADNTSPQHLARLYLDVAGLASRWHKPLSCRVFPVPDMCAGDMTAFESPFLVNAHVFTV